MTSPNAMDAPLVGVNTNRCLRLRHRPQGLVQRGDLELVSEPLPSVSSDADQALVRNMYISVDPAHRIWMSEDAQYVQPVNLGDVMRARTLGVIVKSHNEEWPVGTYVIGLGGVQEHYVGIPGQTVQQKVPDASTKHLSLYSMHIGLTAWHGVNKILNPQPNEWAVVSGAAGAVGSVVGQLCSVKGAKTVGICGGPDKCRRLLDEYSFNEAIDYKSEDVRKRLKEIAPDGFHHYFDNVGGPITDAVLEHMRFFGKVALCGSISEYNSADDSSKGIKNYDLILQRRLKVQGFICTDHKDEYDEWYRELHDLHQKGALHSSEDIRHGIENYANVLNLLFTGENKGKLMIQV